MYSSLMYNLHVSPFRHVSLLFLYLRIPRDRMLRNDGKCASREHVVTQSTILVFSSILFIHRSRSDATLIRASGESQIIMSCHQRRDTRLVIFICHGAATSVALPFLVFANRHEAPYPISQGH